MKKLTNFSLNDFYDNLDETFFDMEMEFVDKEEYRNAGIMLEAQKQIQHEKQLHNILNGNNIIHSTQGPKTSN